MAQQNADAVVAVAAGLLAEPRPGAAAPDAAAARARVADPSPASPVASKIDKQQLDRDKVERERIAQLASKTSSSTGYGLASGVNPPFSAGMVIDI